MEAQRAKIMRRNQAQLAALGLVGVTQNGKKVTATRMVFGAKEEERKEKEREEKERREKDRREREAAARELSRKRKREGDESDDEHSSQLRRSTRFVVPPPK